MISEYERFNWREKEPGRWTRDLDEPETCYVAARKLFEGSGRSFFHITGHITLETAIPEGMTANNIAQDFNKALRKAWVALRYNYPSIATQIAIENNEGKWKWVREYLVTDDGWLGMSFNMISGEMTGKDWTNQNPPAPAYAVMNVLSPLSRHEGRVRRDLIFRAPHDIVDGIGTLFFLDNYARLVAEALKQGDHYEVPSPNDSTIIERLNPPYRVAAAIPVKHTERMKERVAAIEAANESHSLSKAEEVGLPYNKGPQVPGVHKRAELALSQEDTTALLSAAKGIGATVTQVFHAAIALVLRDLQVKSDQDRPVCYVSHLLRDERGSCLPPYSDRNSMGVYHSISAAKMVIKMTVAGKSQVAKSQDISAVEFMGVVEQMKQFYSSVREDKDYYALAPYFWTKFMPPISADEWATTSPIPPPDESAIASISSLGLIDRIIASRHGSVEVYDPWVTGEELRTGFGLYLGTHRGILCLSAVYNDVWHNVHEAPDFLAKCMDLVKSSLGI